MGNVNGATLVHIFSFLLNKLSSASRVCPQGKSSVSEETYSIQTLGIGDPRLKLTTSLTAGMSSHACKISTDTHCSIEGKTDLRKTCWVLVLSDMKGSCVPTASRVTQGLMLTTNAIYVLQIQFRMF